MQGFNMGRYVPPDHEGTTSGNALHKKHPLGRRASKLASQGILTVRFEMPYAIWCLSCPKPTIIAQGVRFNAEKKRAGNYFSTPIWEFRFRHAECGGAIIMRTDPKNTAYVVVEGARKRDTGGEADDAAAKDGVEGAILTDKERDELRNNAFASLEKTIADRKRLEMAADRIEDLQELSGRHWSDPYALNQRLRRDFRKGRKERERDAARAEDLKARMGLGMELVDEAEEDAQRARLVDFGAGEEGEGGERALTKPLFSATTKAQKTGTKRAAKTTTASKAEREASRRKEAFVAGVLSNTRAAQDPFLLRRHASAAGSGSGSDRAANRPSSLGVIKRKKDRGGGGASDDRVSDETKNPVQPVQGLVGYDSD
ncbi:Coiled-coil domain-containing protein 130 [Trichoderma ghanense]|uniref:Coiled-coil domain-containing protein 130 n=1 Tax=Trichoderma ghanense TaxID=65468 RepID=A0ABY2GR44_9HYPO